MSRQDPYINKLIFSKYLIRKKIGKGSFGTVYQGVNTSTNEKIALKVEKRDKNSSGTLENEALRLVCLQGDCIPKVYCYGNNYVHNLLVEELLGKSLESIFNSYGKPFSLKTVCVLGIEMVKRMQYIHNKHFIHRDIKPDNFMTGRGANEKKIYLIDFGLAKKYYSVSRAQHIKFVTGKHLIGTARYCGRNAHRGYEQGRRDDIESVGYVLMYFLLGVLPWQGLKVKKNEDQFEKIAQKKYSTSFEELTAGQPQEFLLYFKHVDNLNFEDQPNYVYLIGLFQNVIDRFCKDCFYDFDWNKDSYNYVSKEIKNFRKSVDVSLIVNKNNDASAVDYSNEGNEEENENDDENEDDDNNNVKNKKIKKKEVFLGEDKSPMDNEDINDEEFYNKNKGRINRSRSMVNINQKMNKKFNDKKYLQKGKNQRGSQIYNNNTQAQKQSSEYNNKNNFNNISSKNINENEEQTNNENNENENYNNDNYNNEKYNDGFGENENEKNEGNNDYENQKSNSIANSSINNKNENNYNQYGKRKNRFKSDINEFPPYMNQNNNDFNNGSINDDKYNFNYNNEKSDYHNDIYNEENKNENNEDINQTKDENEKENRDNNNEFDHFDDDIHDLSFEPEEGSKKKRRNRSGSVDDRKYKSDNVKCQCFIF